MLSFLAVFNRYWLELFTLGLGHVVVDQNCANCLSLLKIAALE